jgi:tetratricopeptide (TPR) repeat protein
VRVGINSGRVATGPVGAQDETVIALGDPVNVAARLQAAATPGGIVVGEAVADALSERFVFDDLGFLSVKGRNEAVRAFELLGIVDRPHAQFLSAFVGRDSELDDATAAFDDLQAGRGQVVTIVGDGGIGKTRLLAEIRSRLPADAVWLGATCDALDLRLPYEPFEQVLRECLGVDRGLAGIRLRARFRSVMRDLLAERYEECAPQLARILGIELEERLMGRLEGLPTDALTKDLQSAVGSWLEAIATERFVVLAIDNFHDSSEATASLVASLVDRLETLPILLLLTMRRLPTSAAWRTRIDALANHATRCQDLVLKPLNRMASLELVDAIDEQISLDGRLRDVVVERAEGNPLYIEQLVSAIRSQGEPIDGPMPPALESFLLSRIDALSSEARRTLQAAAVVGRTFPEDVVATMVGDQYRSAVTELLRADVLREHQRAPRQLSFRHGLLREAALSTLTRARRHALHSAAADAIAGWTGFEVETYGNDLVQHLMESGGDDRAVECLEVLGDRLSLVYRTDDAKSAYDRALNLLGRNEPGPEYFRVAMKKCELLGAAGEAEAALEAIEEALDMDPDPSTRDALLLCKAQRLGEGDRIDAVESVLDDLLPNAEPEIAARALVLRAWLAFGHGDAMRSTEAIAALNQVDCRLPEIEFERMSLAGGVAAHSGEFRRAHELLVQAHEIAQSLGRVSLQLVAGRRIGVMLLLTGEIGESFGVLYAVYEKYKSLGLVVGQLETAVNLLTCALQRGELERGREIAREALTLTTEPAWLAMLLANSTQLEIEMGSLDAAGELIDRLAGIERTAPPWVVFTRGLCWANLLIARGDFDAAYRELERQRASLAGGSETELVLIDGAQGEVLRAMDRWDEAFEHAAAAFARRRETEFYVRLQIERGFAAIVSERDPTAGVSQLLGVLKAARQSGMRLEEARCLVALAEADQANRSVHFAEARAIFERCGAKLGLQELERAQAAANSRLSPV